MLPLDHQDVETGDGEEEPWRAVRQRRPGAKPVEAISGLFSQVSTLGNNLSRAIPGAEDRRQGARPDRAAAASSSRLPMVEAAGEAATYALSSSNPAARSSTPPVGWLARAYHWALDSWPTLFAGLLLTLSSPCDTPVRPPPLGSRRSLPIRRLG